MQRRETMEVILAGAAFRHVLRTLRMARKVFQKYFPSLHRMRDHPRLRFLGSASRRENLWHLNRRSVARAFAIGLFCAFLPVPAQMALAGAAAVLCAANLPLAVVLVWISNPLTIPPLFLFCYLVGAWLLGRDAAPLEEFAWSWSWLADALPTIGLPLLAGSLLVGAVAGAAGYAAVLGYWRWYVVRVWRTRHRRRMEKALHKLHLMD